MTIYALSTGSGISGIAIIRISGIKSSHAIKALTNTALPKPKTAVIKKFSIFKINDLT